MPKLADCLRVRLDKNTEAKALFVVQWDKEYGFVQNIDGKQYYRPLISEQGDGRQRTEEKAHPPL
jgi:hypothetical protein